MKNITLLLLLTIFTLPSFAKAGELGPIESYVGSINYYSQGHQWTGESQFVLDISRVFRDAFQDKDFAGLMIDVLNQGKSTLVIGDAFPENPEDIEIMHSLAQEMASMSIESARRYLKVHQKISESVLWAPELDARAEVAANSLRSE